MTIQDLYDRDFDQWATRNAELLRSGRLAEIDTEHLAEEIEDMAKRDRRELFHRLQVLVARLLKFRCQPAKRSVSWTKTIRAQRDQIELTLDAAPSLKRYAREVLPLVYPKAVLNAVDDTRLPKSAFPETCPFSLHQILAEDYFPE